MAFIQICNNSQRHLSFHCLDGSAGVFRVEVSVFRRVGARPLKFTNNNYYINPIQLGKHTQASSSSVSLRIATAAASSIVRHVPEPKPSTQAVPFSCFQVVCNLFVFRMGFLNCLSLGWTLNFREVFSKFRFHNFQIVILS